MKNINKYIRAFLIPFPAIVMLIGSCKKPESMEPVSNDMTKPDVVTNVKVTNFNGGAYISYSLPNSKNLLYVLAQYNINDKQVRETNVSYYKDTIAVDGFADAREYEVTLYVVSRANVKSDPVKVKVNPATPNYKLVNSNLTIVPDFGGANFSGGNPNRVPISVHLIAYNETTQKYEEREPEYISSNLINVSIRGYSPKPTKFGVYTTDRFGNVSDTVFKILTPLFEMQLDKKKFFTYTLPTDSPIGFGWILSNLFDGNIGEPGWHTLPGSGKMTGTFGLGTLAKISRFVVWQRPSSFFGFQNTRKFTIWGSDKNSPGDVQLPKNSAEGSIAGDWINMGNFIFPDPQSGLPPSQANNADLAFVAKGVDFTMPFISPSVKYIRYECTQTWGGLDYVNALEITLYGNPL